MTGARATAMKQPQPTKLSAKKPTSATRASTKKRRAALISPPMPPMLVSVEDAAHLLAVSRYHVYQLINAGILPSLKIGKHRRISVKALDVYVNGPLAS